MRKDTIYIGKATLAALCFGCLVSAVLYWRNQTATPGTILLQNTIRDADEVRVFGSFFTPPIQNHPLLFTLHSQEAREFVQSLDLKETPNMMATYDGPCEFRFIKAHKVLARLFYDKGGFPNSDVRWPNGAEGAQYGSLVGPLKPRSKTYVDGVLRNHGVLLDPMK